MDVLRHGANGKAFSQFQRGEMRLDRLSSVFFDKLGTISKPVLFIHGVGDKLVPAAKIEEAVNRMRFARLEILEAGHWPMRERPEEFNALVHEFLAEPA